MKIPTSRTSAGRLQSMRSVREGRGGYINFIVVLNIGIVCLGLLFFQFRAAMQSQDVQREVLVRVDSDQREEAVLRALLSIVPNKAMEAMRSGSSNVAGSLTWETIFMEAMQKGNAFEADADGIVSLLPHEDLFRANPSDLGTTNVGDVVSAIGNEPGVVSSGVNRSLGDSYPPYLNWSGAESSSDAEYPIITFAKRYGSNATPHAQLSTDLYPLYNRLAYPNIRFGYAEAGEPFIAKRNWWAFEISYGAATSEASGVAPVTKRYVLSLYEVPSQLPISSNAMASLGKHADANQSAWDATRITIEGGVFGSRLRTEGDVVLDRLATRTGLDIQGSTIIGGETIQSGFDSGNFIQQFDAASAIADTRFYPVSVSAGSGRVAFVPLNIGLDFYRYVGIPEDIDHLSPTGWNTYSKGAFQCAMRLIVTEAASEDDQAPVEVVFSYLAADGQRQPDLVYRVDDGTWTDSLPFQPDSTATGRSGLGIDMKRMVEFMQDDLGIDLAVNHSLLINPDPSEPTVRQPSHPSDPRDMVVILRESEDFTAFPRGFSFVTNCRLYYANDFNIVSTTPPVGSGLESSAEPFHPPVSVFAPEQRYGVTADTRNIEFTGSVATLDDGSGAEANPLDFVSSADTIDPERIRADLKSMTSPAELPPIHLMNWLLTIEEVP